jgi:hypothetical protein
MTKPLTLLNREDKGDVDPELRDVFAPTPSVCFPSYFDDFCALARFLTLQMNAACNKRVVPWKRKFPLAAAIMAIV